MPSFFTLFSPRISLWYFGLSDYLSGKTPRQNLIKNDPKSGQKTPRKNTTFCHFLVKIGIKTCVDHREFSMSYFWPQGYQKHVFHFFPCFFRSKTSPKPGQKVRGQNSLFLYFFHTSFQNVKKCARVFSATFLVEGFCRLDNYRYRNFGSKRGWKLGVFLGCFWSFLVPFWTLFFMFWRVHEKCKNQGYLKP